MTDQEIADKLKVTRMTVHRWRKDGVLDEKLQNVTSEEDVTSNVTDDYVPNWKRNKNPLTGKPYVSKEEALATVVGMVTKELGTTIMLGGELYGWQKKK